MKRAACRRPFRSWLTLYVSGVPELGAIDVLSLESLRPPFHLKLHFRAFLQRPIAGHLDCREVNKYILAAGPLDKSIALGGVKPFDDTLFSHYLISPLSLSYTHLTLPT